MNKSTSVCWNWLHATVVFLSIGVFFTGGAEGAPLDPWTGTYFGFMGGANVNAGTTTFAGANYDSRVSGPAAGLYAGYNVQLGSWVWGIDTGFLLETARGSVAGLGAGNESAARWDTFGRGRLGYSFADNKALLYTTVGAAWASWSVTAAGNKATDWKFGLTVGGGLEYELAPHILGRLDYSLQRFDVFHEPLPSGGPVNADITAHLWTAGAAVKF